MSYGNYPNLKKIKKILVIKLRHHGDVLLSSPVFTLLKKACPDVLIDACVYQDTLPMLEGHPAIENFLVYDKKWKKFSIFRRACKEIKLMRQVRKEKYDLVLNLTEGDRGAIFALVSGSSYCVGFDPEGKGFKGKRKVYTHIVKNCSLPRHTVEKNLDALRSIGIFPSLEERELFLDVPEEARQKVRLFLRREGIEEKEYCVIHPVSRWRFKCTTPKKIAEIIQHLNHEKKKVVLSSGPDPVEIAMIEEIVRLCPEGTVCSSLAGRTNLKELAALIQLSGFLICVDTVALHIGSSLKVPTVALFGPSSDQNWGPWMHPQSRVVARNWSCRPCCMDGCGGSKMSDCLYTLPVQDVINALKDLGYTS